MRKLELDPVERTFNMFETMRDRHVEQYGVSWEVRYEGDNTYYLSSFHRKGVAKYGTVRSDGSIEPPLDFKPETKGNGRKALDQIAFLCDELGVDMSLHCMPDMVAYYEASGWQVQPFWPKEWTRRMFRRAQARTASQVRRMLDRQLGAQA